MTDLPWLVYLLCALVLVASGVLAARARAKSVGVKGPGIVVSLLIWAGLIGLVALLYQASAVWAALLALFN